jgi:hypothetical protein
MDVQPTDGTSPAGTIRSRRWVRRTVGWLLVVLAVIAVAKIPVATKQGVNLDVSVHHLPLYLKSLEFVERSGHYMQLANEIMAGASSDAERVERIFAWTRRHIRQTPDGWPVVDDHILNIIIRGHGLNDQQADVFTTLCTYAGVPAFWAKVPAAPGPHLLLSFAQVDGHWRVFDVAEGVAFRRRGGALATLADVRGDPALIPAELRALPVGARTYSDVMARAAMPSVPHPLRAELQMPMPRLWHELRAAVHLEPHESD